MATDLEILRKDLQELGERNYGVFLDNVEQGLRHDRKFKACKEKCCGDSCSSI